MAGDKVVRLQMKVTRHLVNGKQYVLDNKLQPVCWFWSIQNQSTVGYIVTAPVVILLGKRCLGKTITVTKRKLGCG